jgi:hypothetical protein
MSFNGEPLRENDVVNLAKEGDDTYRQIVVKGKEMTLGSVCQDALNRRYPDDKPIPETFIDRYLLAKQIQQSGDEGLELESKQIVQIRELLAKTPYTSVVIGQTCQLLEGKDA